jgi:ArsR family transcriptional regulator
MIEKPDLTIQAVLAAERACNPNLRIRIGLDEAENAAQAFKAIGHPVRVQILDLIGQGGGEICGCEIESHFDLTQPTISHHLKVLRDAGLITSEPRGVWVHHRINSTKLETLRGLLAGY